MAAIATDRLLAAVARRCYLARLARIAFVAFLVAAALQAAAILLARLTGVVPDLFTPLTLPVPALVALAVGVIASGIWVRTSRAKVAQLVDQRLGTDDLFLTAQSIAGSAGEYQDIVIKRAEARAAQARPAQVLPFAPWPRFGWCVACIAALAVAVLALPQLDPFGREAERAKLAHRREQLRQVQEAAKLRVEALKQTQPEAPMSEAVAKELAKLTATFDNLKPDEKSGNAAKLAGEQQMLGKALSEKLKDQQFASGQEPVGELQRLGAGDLAKSEALKQELAKGETRAADEQLDELKKLADQLAGAKDSAGAQKLRQELKEKLETLAAAAKGDGAKQALQQALDQLAQGGNPDLAKPALAGLKDSLDLARLEMKAGAKDARDGEALKEALKALQMARQLNDQEALDGKGCSECKGGGLAAYTKLYAQMLLKRGLGGKSGDGPGMGQKPGQGKGGKGQENDAATTDYKSERSPTQLTAGETIMQWKTHGDADKGIAQEDYQRSLQAVKQEVSEALLHEQLPPGYEAAVKRYFDSLEAPKPAP